MHTDINYSNIADEAERKAKALKDFIEWLGSEKRVAVLRAYAEAEDTSYNDFAMACSFGGIQGYPVKVAFEHWSGREAVWDDAN